jgi:Protein of unknown function (DUF3223)
MARSNSIDLSTANFPTQRAATEFFKKMLGRYQPGVCVNEEDALHLAALLERHTEYTSKIGCGVDHFEVMMTEHGTQCFRIVRVDGTGTDFSYLHCIKGRPPPQKQEVSQALRQAIRIDLYRARDKFYAEHKGNDGTILCAVTNQRILPEDGHMDHRPPLTFEVIVITFLEGRGLSFDRVPITDGIDEQVAPEVTDEGLREDFRKYHASVARLDFVKKTINLAQSSRERIKPSRIQIKS